MVGAREVLDRRPHRGSSHGAGGRAVTVGQAVDVVDVPVELARPVVAELTAGCLRGPVLRRGPGRWAVLTAPHRRGDFALPESLVRANVRLLPEGFTALTADEDLRRSKERTRRRRLGGATQAEPTSATMQRGRRVAGTGRAGKGALVSRHALDEARVPELLPNLGPSTEFGAEPAHSPPDDEVCERAVLFEQVLESLYRWDTDGPRRTQAEFHDWFTPMVASGGPSPADEASAPASEAGDARC
ncbi:hypothetical protein ATK30_3292 [Amycolatopsis echigonensis]|uniref:Uncharacterized protein n=1 Tax=Amycolatopsis echigonensis TaxID=2576905 RepID=A0A2N3WF61_9PSEU|nr:hypothetical protein ATK30_3292 [Amycolatopsis niigatensis]